MPKIPQLDITRCSFPKHRGVLWTTVVILDRPYMEWLVSLEGPTTLANDLFEYLMTLLEGTPDEESEEV